MTDRLKHLFARHISGALSAKERLELMGLWLEPSLEPVIKELLAMTATGAGEGNGMTEQEIKLLLKKVFEVDNTEKDDFETEKKVIEMLPAAGRRVNWKRWMVAASILLLLGIGSYFLFFNQDNKPAGPVVANNDVEAPKGTKATITLTDGRKVSVDNLTSVNDGQIRVIKNEKGQIVYEGTTGEVVYNLLDNPRGSPVTNITLIDGSKVWLNSASSLKYFTSNAGEERRVEITGEAYFEVTKDVSRPFIIKKGETEVTVLGTMFNVNAYDDEVDIKVTLLEGSVALRNPPNDNPVIIKPGEQAQITNSIRVTKDIDIDEVMAWKNGKFLFGEKVDIQTIMRQIARWYDVDVEYRGTITKLFGGSISRQVNVSEVLRVLEATGGVKYSIEGRKVIVTLSP